MNYKKILITAFAVIALCCCWNGGGDKEAETEMPVTPPDPIGFQRDAFAKDSSTVRTGETLTSLLSRFGMSSSDAYELSTICTDVFDVRKFRAGNKVSAYYSGDSLARRLEYFVYENDKVRSTVFKCTDTMRVWTFDKPVTVERKTLDMTIENSLWYDMVSAGASPLLILDLSDVYAWTVNFFGLQKGDRFRAVYNQKSVEGEVIGIEGIDFSLYESGSFKAYAVCFDQHDGGNRYWNEKGESMKKAFLKAPLKFTRISSRFSYHRKHPVTGKVKAHTAVDYAAPTGTPVQSIGDGTVTLCGWDPTGGGNRIRIRHMNGYETCYMHLRGFAKGVRAGSRVAQGQVIGYVGATGTATGPHLDFRVWKDGKPIDPLKMISPPAQPLDKANMDSLSVLVGKYKAELGIE